MPLAEVRETSPATPGWVNVAKVVGIAALGVAVLVLSAGELRWVIDNATANGHDVTWLRVVGGAFIAGELIAICLAARHDVRVEPASRPRAGAVVGAIAALNALIWIFAFWA